MEREIKGILSKSRKESQGYVYELRAIKEGYYLNVRTKQHDVHLKPGDIWKIGDTTKGVGRYKNDSYEFNNLKM